MTIDTSYINPKDAEWRISKDGYSIKSGYGDDEVNIAKYTGMTIETYVPSIPNEFRLLFEAEEFSIWLDDAGKLCELHNAAIQKPSAELQSLLDAKTKQFNALKLSYDCKADIAAKLAPNYKAGEEALATLDSERAINEQLTNLCERLEQDVERLREALRLSTNGLRHCSRWNISDEKEKVLMCQVIANEDLLSKFSALKTDISSLSTLGDEQVETMLKARALLGRETGVTLSPD